MSFNKIIILGNLGRDPELRYTPQGMAVCDFSMATTEKKKDKAGQHQEVTTWFKVTLWDHKAEVASKYLQKGSQVYIEGRLTLEEWTDRDGNTRTSLRVSATDMQFVGQKQSEDQPSIMSAALSATAANDQAKGIVTQTAADDGIPF